MKLTAWLVCFCLSVSTFCFASEKNAKLLPQYDEAAFDSAISEIYHDKKFNHAKDIKTRVQIASAWFLGKPYELGALGEGPHGRIDQHPLYRSDAFDCVTYVATVLALAHADNLTQFQHQMQRITYLDGDVQFQKRLHFTSIDWNPNAQHLGFIRDITHQILDNSGMPVAQIADTIINKPQWYQHKQLDTIAYRTPLSSEKQQAILQELRDYAKQVQPEKAVILYVPLTALFQKDGTENAEIFAQIPNASIIEVVRPAWDLEARIGTKLHVSHLGFAFRTKDGLIFREASSDFGKVVDVPLADYLKPYLSSATIKGINIQKIV